MTFFNKDKFNRMNNLMGAVGSTVKPTSAPNVLYKKTGLDGKTYVIVQESNTKFSVQALKGDSKNLLAENMEYINGEANKEKYIFENYQKALKSLNVMFGEQRKSSKSTEKFMLKEDLEEKYVIKQEVEDNSENVSMDDETPDETEGEMDNMDSSEEDMDMSTDDLDEDDPKTQIQKLTGKLGYGLGEFEGEDEEYSDLAKYVINSILSRVDVDKMSEEDVKDIIGSVMDKLQKSEEEENMEQESNSDTEEYSMDEVVGEAKVSEILEMLSEDKDPNITKGKTSYSESPTAKMSTELHDDVNKPNNKVKVEDHNDDPNKQKDGNNPYTKKPTSTTDEVIDDVNKPNNKVKVEDHNDDPNKQKDTNNPYTEKPTMVNLLENYTMDEIMAELEMEPLKKKESNIRIFPKVPQGASVDKTQEKVSYDSERTGEDEFEINGKPFQYVNGLYPVTTNGELIGYVRDIAVYTREGDLTYGFDYFTKNVLNKQNEGLEECDCDDNGQDDLLTDLELDERKKKSKKNMYGFPMDFYDQNYSMTGDFGDVGGDFGGMGEEEEPKLTNRGGMGGIKPQHNPFNFIKNR